MLTSLARGLKRFMIQVSSNTAGRGAQFYKNGSVFDVSHEALHCPLTGRWLGEDGMLSFLETMLTGLREQICVAWKELIQVNILIKFCCTHCSAHHLGIFPFASVSGCSLPEGLWVLSPRLWLRGWAQLRKRSQRLFCSRSFLSVPL